MNKTEQARMHLHEQGYQVANLWHVDDVSMKYECTTQEAHDVLERALTNEWVMEQIHFAISQVAEQNGLKKREPKFRYTSDNQSISKAEFERIVPADWKENLDEFGCFSWGNFRATLID